MRGFSLIEVMVVVSVTAVLAGSAIAITTRSARDSRVRDEMERLLKDLASQRASHVAEGRNELLLICNDCVDERGESKAGALPGVVDFYLGDDLGDRRHGRVIGGDHYDLVVDVGCTRAALDALGRSIALGAGDALPNPDGSVPTVPGDCTLTLRAADGSGAPQRIVLGADGRINSTFAQSLIPEPAHARNFSARTTPNPMDRGRFEGDSTRALAVPLR